MNHRRMKYAAGYCVALLVIAGTWIRLSASRLPEQETAAGAAAGTETVETMTRTVEEARAGLDPESALLVGTIRRGAAGPSGNTGTVEEGRSYQALYPDMYVSPKSKEASAKVSEDETRKIYLTFDDGPSEITKEVVEALEKADAKATFFLIGSEITPEREDLVRQMAEDGHIIGVHTYSHDKKDLYSSVESFLEDFHKAYERIYEVTGQKPVYYRFPWGSVNCYNKNIRAELIAEMERRGFQFFDWNVSAEDSVGKPTEYSVLHNVVDYFPKYRNAVVLMHDSNNNKISAGQLPKILAAVQEAGYEFGTIDEMEKPYQWVR